MSTTPAFLRGTDTPTRMRVLGVMVALAAAVYGVVASAVVAARTDQLDEARAAAAQIERIETVRTAVVEADSLATAAYLAKGLESPQRRADYEDRLATASRDSLLTTVQLYRALGGGWQEPATPQS